MKFILGTVYFNHRHGCQKCSVVGIHFATSHCVCYAEFNSPLRTDESFRQRIDPRHHRENSPLEDIQLNGQPFLDMIQCFPTSDPMHLLEEGVMKRNFKMWFKGTTVYRNKMSDTNKTIINSLIEICNKHKPSDIHRKVRELKFMKDYKATEFRTILLYTGMILFKDTIPSVNYYHFLRLCLAVRLCSATSYVKNARLMECAKVLLSEYCDGFVSLYGKDSVVSNIHNLSHIIDDVRNLGSLNEISTYPFENHLKEIKSRVQASKAPLEQITRRIIELSIQSDYQIEDSLNEQSNSIELKYELDENSFKFIKIKTNVFFSSKKVGDSFFMTENKEIVQFKYAKRDGKKIALYGNEFISKNDFFSNPYSSKFSDIYLCTEEKSEERCFAIENIKAKMYCIPFEDQFVLIPLLHSIDEFDK